MNFISKIICKQKLTKRMHELLDLMEEHKNDEDSKLFIAYAVACANVQLKLITGNY